MGSSDCPKHPSTAVCGVAIRGATATRLISLPAHPRAGTFAERFEGSKRPTTANLREFVVERRRAAAVDAVRGLSDGPSSP